MLGRSQEVDEPGSVNWLGRSSEWPTVNISVYFAAMHENDCAGFISGRLLLYRIKGLLTVLLFHFKSLEFCLFFTFYAKSSLYRACRERCTRLYVSPLW